MFRGGAINRALVGRNIMQARRTAELSQSDVAQLLGRSQQLVGEWERGVALPNTRDLQRLMRVLRMSVEDLLDGAGEEGAIEWTRTELLGADIAHKLRRMGERQRGAVLEMIEAMAG